MISTDRLADLFVEVADTLVDDFDVVDFLHDLTMNAASISGAGAVGLMLSDQQGRLQLMGASNPAAQDLELVQLRLAQGPCLDCFATGQSVVNADLAHATGRWPLFAAEAVAAGFQSVHAFPMRLRTETIGALNLFGTLDQQFSAEETRVIQALADVATIGILQERAVTRAETLTEQLQGALQSRVTVEQAKGVVASRLGVSVDDAFTLLRDRARSRRVRLVEVATQVLGGDVEGLRPAPPHA